MKPIIGITCTYDNSNHDSYQRLNHAYIDAIELAGGLPVIIPCIPGVGITKDYIERIDGLLLSGGADISPLLFDEETINDTVKSICWERDLHELALFKEARAKNLPVLGVCRGLQVANVAMGGTLIQDIPAQIENSILHNYIDTQMDQLAHTIIIEKSSLLYKAMGSEKEWVNSFHHQSAGKVGKGLKVTAKSPDGVIEAMEGAAESTYLHLVQFHPESLCRMDAKYTAIYKQFVDVCKK